MRARAKVGAGRRPTITDGMKYRALKRSKVLVQCVDCVAVRARLEAKGMHFEDDTTWHSLSGGQFDHIWELADKGPNKVKNLRFRCLPCHQTKSAKSESMRHHLDRAGKKHRGEWKAKKPMRKHPTLKRTVGGQIVSR